jgi:hypothetical protein
MTSRRPSAWDRRRWLAHGLGGLVLVVVACGDELPTGEGTHASSGGSTPMTTSTTAMPTPTTSTTATGAADTTAGSTDDGVVFLQEPDGWGAMFECDIFEQDCAPGRKCVPYSSDGRPAWNATRCIRIASPPRGKGEPCTIADHAWSGVDDCDGGLICWDVDERTLEGTCAALCVGDESNPTCADPCEECPITSNGALLVCRRACEPLLQDCPHGEACYWIGDDLGCAPDLSPAGAGIGSPCEFINVCPEGTTCLYASHVPGCPAGSDGCCAPFCAAAGVDVCPELLPGTSCVPIVGGGGGLPAECQSAPPGLCMLE